jgi:hypothetical protein
MELNLYKKMNKKTIYLMKVSLVLSRNMTARSSIVNNH